MKSSKDDRKKVAVTAVADCIRNFILDNGLEPGDRLPVQGSLSEQLGIGIRRLREGMSVLEHQGFVETRNKAGTIVRRPMVNSLSESFGWHLDADGCELEQVVRVRAMLEAGAAEEAARERTARDLLVLLDILEQLETRDKEGASDVKEDEAFHLAILQATHNPALVTFGQLITLQFERMSRKGSFGPQATSNEQHRAIFEAIERRDGPVARDLMHEHLLVSISEDE